MVLGELHQLHARQMANQELRVRSKQKQSGLLCIPIKH